MEPQDRRRRFLKTLAATGVLSSLAGCNSSGGDDTDTPEATPTDRPKETPKDTRTETSESTSPTQTPEETNPVSVQLETRVREAEQAQRLQLSGQIRASAGVESVTIDAGDDSTTVRGDGSVQQQIDTGLTVEGGRSYDISIRVLDSRDNEHTRHIETRHIPIFIDPLTTDQMVGAHYYPWYETRNHRDWLDSTVSEPTLGEYASDDKTVIDRHLKWSLEHGIRWWSVSWWGRSSPADHNLRHRLLPSEQFSKIRFSILYETVGQFEEYDFDLDRSVARSRLKQDFEYLEEQFFNRETYRRIDDRPVVYFYVAGALRGDVEEAFAEATANLETDPYILAGVPFGTPPDSYPVASAADAVTSYTPYTPREDIDDVFHDLYSSGNKIMHLGADAVDMDFVPVVTPGMNDSGIPDTQREDSPVLSASPDRFERVCDQVSPHLADGNGVLVTSFNEWYEDTQVEPSEEYGAEYLERVADRLATGSPSEFELTGKQVRLVFNKTVVPAERYSDSEDTRELAFVASEISLLNGDREVASFNIGDPSDEPLFPSGAYAPSSYGDVSVRWLGGQSAETVIFFEGEFSGVDRMILTGQPMISDGITAAVFSAETKTDQIQFGERDDEFDDYEISLQAS